jgi:hypothetical protein
VSIRKSTIQGLIGWLKMEGAKCKLHPLIHTFLEFDLAQDIVYFQLIVAEKVIALHFRS